MEVDLVETFRTTHTRSQGMRLTYEIEVESNVYRIRLGRKLLKDKVLPITIGNVTAIEAAIVWATQDIEQLRGMQES